MSEKRPYSGWKAVEVKLPREDSRGVRVGTGESERRSWPS